MFISQRKPKHSGSSGTPSFVFFVVRFPNDCALRHNNKPRTREKLKCTQVYKALLAIVFSHVAETYTVSFYLFH
jgi:hypothetical protein